MYYVKVQKLNDWWIMLFFGVQCRCSECQVKGYIILSKETRIEKKKKAFGKSFVQVKWFLLISGLGLILV